MKRFAIQDSIVNYGALLYRPFNPDKLEDYIVINSKSRIKIKKSKERIDPLELVSRPPMQNRFANCKMIRLKGTIETHSVIIFQQ